MRKTILTALVLMSTAGFASTQQQNTMATPGPEHKIGVGIEPLWLIIGGVGAKVDMRMNDRVSLGVAGMYVPSRSNTTDDKNSTTSSSYKFSVYDVYFGPTFYINGTYDTNGFYGTTALGRTGATISDYGTDKLNGTVDAWEARLTAGYQWFTSLSSTSGNNNIRIGLGAGYRFISAPDVVIKDSTGAEIRRVSSSSLGGLALDLNVSYLF